MKTIDTTKEKKRKSASPKSRQLLPELHMPKQDWKPGPARSQSSLPADQTESSCLLTTIAADVDVGFGNAVFIRGEGPGLNWEKGVPLLCAGDKTWIWASTDVTEKVTFKLLLNDARWAEGENLSVEPGKDVRTTPAF